MGVVVFKGFRVDLVAGNVGGSADVRTKLVMSNSTCATDEDAAHLSDFGVIDEYDGAGYAEITHTAEAIASDDTNDRHEFSVADGTFGATVSAGTRQAVGMLTYRRVGSAATDVPWFFTDDGGFPFDGTGGAVNYSCPPEGMIQIAQGA